MSSARGPSAARARRGRVALAVLAAFVALAAAGYAWVTHASASRAARRPFALPAQSPRSYEAWRAAGRDVGFCTLQTGSVRVPRSSMLRRDHRSADTPRELEPLALFVHWIRHPVAGDVLVDTGLDASFVRAPYGNMPLPARLVHRAIHSEFLLAPGEDVGAQLARRGARPALAFFTHLHGDHTAGVPALGTGVRLVTGPREADDVASHVGYGHIGAGRNLEELDFAAGWALGPLARVLDVFGDGSVLAIATPGHTLGHTSYLVHARGGPVLLIGDAAHTAWSFAHGIGPRGITAADDALAQRSLDRLRAFAAAHPEVHLVFGHEDTAPRCDAPG